MIFFKFTFLKSKPEFSSQAESFFASLTASDCGSGTSPAWGACVSLSADVADVSPVIWHC